MLEKLFNCIRTRFYSLRWLLPWPTCLSPSTQMLCKLRCWIYIEREKRKKEFVTMSCAKRLNFGFSCATPECFVTSQVGQGYNFAFSYRLHFLINFSGSTSRSRRWNIWFIGGRWRVISSSFWRCRSPRPKAASSWTFMGFIWPTGTSCLTLRHRCSVRCWSRCITKEKWNSETTANRWHQRWKFIGFCPPCQLWSVFHCLAFTGRWSTPARTKAWTTRWHMRATPLCLSLTSSSMDINRDTVISFIRWVLEFSTLLSSACRTRCWVEPTAISRTIFTPCSTGQTTAAAHSHLRHSLSSS